MNRILKAFVILAVPFIVGAAEFSDYTTLINQKMQTERRLEDHIGGLVTRMVGEGKATVIVSVQLSDMTKSRVQTEQWLEKEKDKIPSPPRQDEFLPGIPLKNTIEEKDTNKESPEKSGGKRMEDILTLPSEFIKSIRVSLLLDKSIPDELVATVESVINEILDLNPAKGDRLTIQRVDFASRSVDFISFFFNPYFYVIALILMTLAIMGIFMFGPLRKFLFASLQTLKDLKGMKSEQEIKSIGAGGGMGFGEGEGEMELEDQYPDSGSGEGAESGEGAIMDGEAVPGEEEEDFDKMTYKPLKFLEERDLKKLAYLLNFEPPDIGALLISYLDPMKGAKVMSAIPAEKRAEVAKSIVKIQRSAKEVLQHVDDFLSRKIDYVAGGADKLVGIIEMMNDDEREKLLETLSEDDPEFAEKVKSRIFGFDDIINLDDSAMQMIIQEVETRDLGIALKNVSVEIKNKFINNMSEGAAALLKEEIEFGRGVTESQIKSKQMDIVAKIKHLETEGMISGVSGGASIELWDEELGEEKRESVLEHIIQAAHDALKQTESLQGGSQEGNTDEEAFEFYQKGLDAYKEENYEEAIEYFRQSLRYNSDVWQTHQYLGTCYLAIGDDTSAKRSYSKSLQLNPDNPELKEWLQTH